MFNELAALSTPESLWLNFTGLICFAAFAFWAMWSVGGGPGARLYRLILSQLWSGYPIGFAAANGA